MKILTLCFTFFVLIVSNAAAQTNAPNAASSWETQSKTNPMLRCGTNEDYVSGRTPKQSRRCGESFDTCPDPRPTPSETTIKECSTVKQTLSEQIVTIAKFFAEQECQGKPVTKFQITTPESARCVAPELIETIYRDRTSCSFNASCQVSFEACCGMKSTGTAGSN